MLFYLGTIPVTLFLCCAPLCAEDAISPPPNEPFLPTNSEECVAFNSAYTKWIDKIAEARLKCIDEHPTSHFDTVAAPMSCVQGGWAGGKSTVMRACARIEDQWCRATVDRQKKFEVCMAQVEDYKKKEIVDEAILHRKTDREKTSSDDEIDKTFRAINKTTDKLHEGQNDVVKKYEETGVDTIKAMEKQAFSELDKALRDADFAELTRAEKPRPVVNPQMDTKRLQKADEPGAKFRNTTWNYQIMIASKTRNISEQYDTTLYFDSGDGVSLRTQVTAYPGMHSRNLQHHGTWTVEGDHLVIQYENRSSYCRIDDDYIECDSRIRDGYIESDDGAVFNLLDREGTHPK
jgi:hypothetical protein